MSVLANQSSIGMFYLSNKLWFKLAMVLEKYHIVSDCSLMPIEKLFSHTMGRTSYV